jgi:hypothetical protein
VSRTARPFSPRLPFHLFVITFIIVNVHSVAIIGITVQYLVLLSVNESPVAFNLETSAKDKTWT